MGGLNNFKTNTELQQLTVHSLTVFGLVRLRASVSQLLRWLYVFLLHKCHIQTISSFCKMTTEAYVHTFKHVLPSQIGKHCILSKCRAGTSISPNNHGALHPPPFSRIPPFSAPTPRKQFLDVVYAMLCNLCMFSVNFGSY